jgi:hypothetical protein
VVELLHSIVRLHACVTVRTLPLFNMVAFFRLIISQWSSFVFFLIMVKRALFHIVASRVLRAGNCFELEQIQTLVQLALIDVLSTEYGSLGILMLR